MRPETWFDHVLYVVLGAFVLAIIGGIMVVALHFVALTIGLFLLAVAIWFAYLIGRGIIGPPDDYDSLDV